MSLFASGLLNHITVSSAFILHSHRLFHYNANDHTVLFRIHPVWVCVPVGGCWEDPQDDIPALHAYDGAGGLQQVEVEVRVSRDRAVQTCFQKRRPLALQHPLRAPQITFTHTCHAGHHHLIHTHTFKRRRFSFYSTQPLFSAIIRVTIHWRTAFQPHTSIVRIQLFDSSVKTSRDMLCSTAFYYFNSPVIKLVKASCAKGCHNRVLPNHFSLLFDLKELEKAILWTEDWYFSQFEEKRLDNGFVHYKHAVFHFIRC